MIKKIISAFVLCISFSGVFFALEIRSVSITDQLGASRSNYSNSEKINLNASVYNDAAIDRISFKFEIKDSAGTTVFTHSGNSIPGTIGSGGSSVKFIPITNFFSSSGNYKLVVTANAVSKEASFSVYSPNITATYPSNYARDLTDNPLVFRWVASGAAKYKIYVARDAAFFNTILTAETTLMQYSYPDNPSDIRQKLSAGTIYYWKVEGVDAAGSIVAKMASPYNFTIKSSAVTVASKDIAILDIAPAPSMPKVTVSVKNQGGKTENSVPLSLYLNGMLVGSQNIDSIAPGETKIMGFLTNMSGLAVAMASLMFDDDNTRNNTLTKQINITPYGAPSAEKAKILGTVMSQSGNKLPYAIVDYKGPVNGAARANKGGEYKIENLSVGEYKLKASASGYLDAELTVTVDKLKSYANVDFKLKSAVLPADEGPSGSGIIKGLVFAEDNKGLENIEILLLEKGKQGKAEEYQKLTTDARGYYRFLDVPAGVYLLSVKNDSYETAEIQFELKSGKTEIRDIKLAARKEETPRKSDRDDYSKDSKKLWTKLKNFIKDEKILSQLDGYEASGMEIPKDTDINRIISELEEDKAKITGTEIIIE